MRFENKRLIGIFVAVAFLLLSAFTVMKFGAEGMKWSAFDFLLAGVVLLGAGLACEFFLRMFKSLTHRLAACAVVMAILCVVWVELAVGILGTPLAGN